MIRRIRNFLCTADPIGITVVIVLAFLIVNVISLLGIVEFLITIAIGLFLAAIFFAAGWLLYKLIVLLQGFCK
ncbi:hypothetical protein LCGC14_1981530 [marine sediment metagenome]|uniref:Uncharacterized protein n=1 Tax=marine sediment metagenome TaxID=412755 RepID=A0A0F9I5U6_9ZZZZ